MADHCPEELSVISLGEKKPYKLSERNIIASPRRYGMKLVPDTLLHLKEGIYQIVINGSRIVSDQHN